MRTCFLAQSELVYFNSSSKQLKCNQCNLVLTIPLLSSDITLIVKVVNLVGISNVVEYAKPNFSRSESLLSI